MIRKYVICNMLGGTQKGEQRPRAEPALTVIQGYDMEAVEELAFILVNPFHLDVKE